GRGLGRDLQHGVCSLTLLAGVIRQAALPPVLHLDDLGTERRDLLGELGEQGRDFFVARTRIDDHENFIRPQNESPPRAAVTSVRSALGYQTSPDPARSTPQKRYGPGRLRRPGPHHNSRYASCLL